MNLLNCIAGGGDIKKILIDTGQQIDKLKLGFEFGTWDFPNYFAFFWIIGKLKKNTFDNNYLFTKIQKNRICKKLKEIITKLPNHKLNYKFPTKEVTELIIKNNPKDKRLEENLGGINPYYQYTKELLQLNHKNPLRLVDKKYYEKLHLIFSQDKVQVIRD